MLSGNGRHRRPRQAPAVVVAAGVTGSALALPLFAASSAGAAEGATWDRVAECESGGAWSADTGNGFYGGLQLSQDQWEEHGGLSYASKPSEASRSQQIAVAERILAEQGATPWLACGAMNGLREDGPAAEVDTGVDALRTGDVTGPGAFDGSASGWGSVGGDLAGTGESGKTDKSDRSRNSDKSGVVDGETGDARGQGRSGEGANGASDHGFLPGSGYGSAQGGGLLDLGQDLGLVDTGTGSPVIPDLPETGGGQNGQDGQNGVGGDSGKDDSDKGGTGKGGSGEDVPVRGDGGEQDGATGEDAPDEDAPLFGDGDGPLFQDDTPLFGGDTAQEESTGSSSGSGRHRGPSADETAAQSGSGTSGRHAAPADTYQVRAGDSLVSIAKSEGVKGGWRALYEENRDLIGKDPDRLVSGMVLTLP
ncbi:transglycosylase family protein [Streptomyces sp. NPDC047130]|uniref:transglycosylase family protein n=1 Tax=Streptomyces sp. NPDC047130 TaxID=3155261 RepID=UPI0033FA0736